MKEKDQLETFLHLIDDDEKYAIKKIEETLNEYKKIFEKSWSIMMSEKLNLDKNDNNNQLIKEFLDLLHVHKLDYTNTFIELEQNRIRIE